MNKSIIKGAKKIACIAVMSATLIIGKFVLSFIPNVEVVTTLVICYAVVFGFDSVFATLVFCIIDNFIYPPSIDVTISYFLYWNLLAIISATLSRLNVNNKNAYLVLGIIMTFLFGVITSFFYSLFFGTPFFAIYLSGLVYYAIHMVSTLVFMLVGYTQLIKVLNRIKAKII